MFWILKGKSSSPPPPIPAEMAWETRAFPRQSLWQERSGDSDWPGLLHMTPGYLGGRTVLPRKSRLQLPKEKGRVGQVNQQITHRKPMTLFFKRRLFPKMWTVVRDGGEHGDGPQGKPRPEGAGKELLAKSTGAVTMRWVTGLEREGKNTATAKLLPGGEGAHTAQASSPLSVPPIGHTNQEAAGTV